MRLAQTRLFFVLAAITVVTVPAWCALIPLNSQGDISGWSASLSGAATGITVNGIDGDTLYVSITKNFGQPDASWQLPVAQIAFVQTGTTAASRIVIQSEEIANNSGCTWTGFRWSIFESGVAMFNTDSNWDISPLQISTWQGVSGGDASILLATGGTLESGKAYEPSGSLLIDTTPSQDGNVRFTLKEMAIPEPTTMALLAVGGLWLRRRVWR